jgi:hypothetical protein
LVTILTSKAPRSIVLSAVAGSMKEDLRGEGLTAAEIASSPEIGAWTEGKDEQSGAEYVETIRRASPRYSW